MIVSMMSVPKGCEANNVNDKPKCAHQQQLIQTTQFVAFIQSVNCVKDDLDADQDQENAICKAGQGVDLAVTIRKVCRRRPFAHDSCSKTHGKTQAIEEHMDTVSKQTERSSRKAVEKLDHHKAKIQAAKVSNPARISLSKNRVHHRTRRAKFEKKCGQKR